MFGHGISDEKQFTDVRSITTTADASKLSSFAIYKLKDRYCDKDFKFLRAHSPRRQIRENVENHLVVIGNSWSLIQNHGLDMCFKWSKRPRDADEKTSEPREPGRVTTKMGFFRGMAPPGPCDSPLAPPRPGG